MTDLEQARRDADALIESLRLDWQELATRPHTREEAEAIRVHMSWCLEELGGLLRQLEADDA